MTTEQRLDRVDNDLAVVRQLLTSAATYAESANRRLDELTLKQDRTQSHIDQIGGRVDQLTAKQDRTQSHIDQIGGRVDQ
ncbi:MAG: 6-aminohexanoate hydrolase, partial [Aulosira sp. DedQUE10]|nr:6-aminohexanoate hydrolase [Aulosira sp. DedQUE10]